MASGPRACLICALCGLCLSGLGCDQVKKAAATKPDVKLVDSGHVYHPLADDECWAEARNAGAAGYVTFTFKTEGGYKATYRTYFDRDENRTVKFTLPGLRSSNMGDKYRLSVEPD
jgi:hypothetical protein